VTYSAVSPLFLLISFWIMGCQINSGSNSHPDSPEPVDLGLAGYPSMPKDNPLTRQGIDLGRRLFYDKILSENNSQACADCHNPAYAFSDTLKFSRGTKGLAGNRNAPSLINAGWLPNFFWDGRAQTLEDQALAPVPNILEMNLPWDSAISRISRSKTYPALFDAAFPPGPITPAKVVKALAQFERTLVSFNSRYDKFLKGEIIYTATESLGLELFNQEKTGCFHCHSGILFTDMEFHNNGLDKNIDSTGRGAITKLAEDDGKWRTPTLRNLVLTPPYMHDGRFSSLEEVMEHYSSGGYPSRTVDPRVPARSQYPLSEMEIQAVLDFLKTLTDSTLARNPGFQAP
jgi:cytochrome c peroxidase